MKVLIIEDDIDFVYLVSLKFKDKGWEVITANTAQNGTKQAIEEVPDLILLDVFLPGQNGFSVLRELGTIESTKDIPVIFFTGCDEEALETLAKATRAYKYLKKHDDLDKLVDFCEGLNPNAQPSHHTAI
jgi:DNA-binding response OmpR family regulator